MVERGANPDELILKGFRGSFFETIRLAIDSSPTTEASVQIKDQITISAIVIEFDVRDVARCLDGLVVG